MAQPTLAYGGSTVTLPYPSGTGGLGRDYGELGGERRTVTGNLRRWTGNYWYGYRVAFEYCDRTTYDDIVSLVRTAAASNAYPVFTWADGPWPSATAGVDVSASISPMEPGGPLYAYVNFSLTLVETTART